jgi:predicted nucleotidyltransferase
MHRNDIVKILKTHEPELRQMGVDHIALFGSWARQEERPESDIDILIDLNTKKPIDLFAYATLKDHITSYFDRSVDVVDRAALKKRLQGVVDKEAIYVF